MNEINDLIQRLDRLETQVAFQEQTIQQLNTTITSQWELIDRLKQRLSRLSDQVREVENSLAPPAAGEPPPPHF